jgi:hypothetical protein
VKEMKKDEIEIYRKKGVHESRSKAKEKSERNFIGDGLKIIKTIQQV